MISAKKAQALWISIDIKQIILCYNKVGKARMMHARFIIFQELVATGQLLALEKRG